MELDVSFPSCEDFIHLAVTLPESKYSGSKNFKIEVPCTLEFYSTKPVSKTDFITITEKKSGIMYVVFLLSLLM